MTNDDWHPIESAPTDGSPILANDGFNESFVCWCDEIDSHNNPVWASASTRDFGGIEEPIVWMPLPTYKGN